MELLQYTVRKLITGIPLVLGVTLISFTLMVYFGPDKTYELLGKNPNWIWTHSGSIPMANGFLNKWHASIPVGSETLEVDGVCTVQLRDGHIYSNEVFFDRADLVEAFANARFQGR